MALVEVNACGLFCPVADLHIDPWKPVPKALITHGHSDHARYGNGVYIAHEHSIPILRCRLGQDINTSPVKFGESFSVNGVNISFHPAGHIPGSAQIRLEHKGEVWVISGDYKTENDGVSIPFEPVKCNVFISESTFGLPIFRWKPQQQIFDEINSWWAENASNGIASVILAYSLGKAQRIIMNVDHSIGPVYTHAAVDEMNKAVRTFFPALPEAPRWNPELTAADYRTSLIVAPSSAANSPWINRFRPFSLAVASGWMNLRGAKRWSAADRGFVLSDHADWDGLNASIRATGAEKVYITHGYTASFSRWLSSQGIEACELETLYEGEKNGGGEEG